MLKFSLRLDLARGCSKLSDSTMVKAKVYIFQRQFNGFPKEGDLKLVEEELPPIKDGEFLSQAVYLSVDPYMRKYAENLTLGQPFIGRQIAKIIESKNPNFPVGRHVFGNFGWRTHTISSGVFEDKPLNFPVKLLPDFQGLPLSLGLGVLGMPGNTAYFGLIDICQPKAGETVVVSGAAGAVGHHAGQIAKILGCRVIGIAGSDEKIKWLKDELGFDAVINYKTQDVAKVLPEIAPEKIDVYFDNVGGEISAIVLKNMKVFGRVSVCGSISGYNDSNAKASIIQGTITTQQLRLQGFLVSSYIDRWPEAFEQNLKWIKEGKLKYRETVTKGFENMFSAFTDMLKGGNIGKAVVEA
ncbi:prostaglandin reductase 1-like [Sitophilus oryzae]|uniref:Prostaglandin reductase 1 n=1 Tax=Sitophilus oryzae TaxID=7048 RepID=A0A6J2XR40_SITOR|nr:prostaglandin reductase 1-like [Sitophilus oryzae]